MPYLKELDLSGCQMNDFAFLSKRSLLSKLILTHSYQLPAPSQISSLKQLKVLDISYCRAPFDLASLREMPSLKTLKAISMPFTAQEIELVRQKIPLCEILCWQGGAL